MKIGSIWDRNVGYGRWHKILKHNLPLLSGKRILDMGCNNSFNSIQMLRSGAREVIGIEMENKFIYQGNFVKAVFDWVDNTYYNFRYIQSNMKEIPTMNLGRFDIVLALCSIYYLDDDFISHFIKYISTITDTFVLQCNIATKRNNPSTYKKASIEYTVEALRCNGFPVVKVIAPSKFSRPLVIGSKEKRAI